MTFAQMIREECRRQGVSGYELMKRIDAHQSYARQLFESKNITERTLRRCARALGMEVECKLVRRKK
jgi:transcriptional regulator with XRE-family HTH domain